MAEDDSSASEKIKRYWQNAREKKIGMNTMQNESVETTKAGTALGCAHRECVTTGS